MKPVALLVSTTDAPEMTAPEGSETVPVTLAVGAWAHVRAKAIRNSATRRARETMVYQFYEIGD